MPDSRFAIENTSLGSCRVAKFDPMLADSATFIDGIEGEVMLALETEMSAAKPNAGGGQMLEGSIYEFAGQGMFTVPVPHGLGAVGSLLFPTLKSYGAGDMKGLAPNGAKVSSVWLCILPDITEDSNGDPLPTHIFVRVVPATKQHLAKFGNPGNRGSQPDAAQFVTTFDPGAEQEPLKKGIVGGTPNAAFMTDLGWTFVPEAPAA